MNLVSWTPHTVSALSLGASVGQAPENGPFTGDICTCITVTPDGVVIDYASGRRVLDRGLGVGEVDKLEYKHEKLKLTENAERQRSDSRYSRPREAEIKPVVSSKDGNAEEGRNDSGSGTRRGSRVPNIQWKGPHSAD